MARTPTKTIAFLDFIEATGKTEVATFEDMAAKVRAAFESSHPPKIRSRLYDIDRKRARERRARLKESA